MGKFIDNLNRQIAKMGLPFRTARARDWLVGKIKSAQQFVVRTGLGTSVSSTIIGNMYFFKYDAKYKDTLPYWDQFPLVFPIEMYGDGFLGINLHYLDVQSRLFLMDRLMEFKNTKNFSANTRLLLSYKLLAGVSKFKLFQPCLKKYLYAHVRGSFILVDPNEWDICAVLPVEQFVGASSKDVFKYSRESV